MAAWRSGSAWRSTARRRSTLGSQLGEESRCSVRRNGKALGCDSSVLYFAARSAEMTKGARRRHVRGAGVPKRKLSSWEDVCFICKDGVTAAKHTTLIA
ncbi:unnamed protein product [Urochloa humidicola]